MSRELTGQACECSVCGLVFRSVNGFDRHRVGTYRPNTRRCLSTAELGALGMVEVRGRWQGIRKPGSYPVRKGSGEEPGGSGHE